MLASLNSHLIPTTNFNSKLLAGLVMLSAEPMLGILQTALMPCSTDRESLKLTR